VTKTSGGGARAFSNDVNACGARCQNSAASYCFFFMHESRRMCTTRRISSECSPSAAEQFCCGVCEMVVLLLDRATDTGKNSVRMRANQSDRAHRYRQNDSEHHCILGDILAFFLPPGFEKKFSHSTPPGLPVSSAPDAPECTVRNYDTMAHPGKKPTIVTRSR